MRLIAGRVTSHESEEKIVQQPSPEYLEAIRHSDIHLVIVGKDPFPKDPTGIPFCKSEWDAQVVRNGSGYFVLSALGFELSLDRLSAQKLKPQELFLELAKAGVVFLNASYVLPGEGRFDKEARSEAFKINEPFLTKATHVICCGKAKTIPKIDGRDYCCVIHPDPRNRTKQATKERWKKAWQPGALSWRWDEDGSARQRISDKFGWETVAATGN